MKIFMTATSLALSYGGPAICVPRLARALAEAGADVSVWSANGKHSKTFGSEGVRISTGENFQQSIAKFGRPDIIHDNGLWLLHNHEIAHYARERAIPRIVSLHGMLEPWARKFKRFKKGLAWHLYQRRDLQIAGALHAACKEEAENLSRIGITAPIVTIPFGADALPRMKVEEAWRWKEARAFSGRRKALFLGRLHPVKGLPNLIEAWANLRPQNWQLVLAGPDEDNYRTHLANMVAARQLQKSIVFWGPVSGDTKTNLILGADLFVLPSLQENFGMAAAEALAGGVPAITTTEAPWSRLPEANAG
ncbi:MAG: glycosyltransferase, partial [Rhodomicrobium sp.]